jgi:predicted naringenin-chalcone synthase
MYSYNPGYKWDTIYIQIHLCSMTISTKLKSTSNVVQSRVFSPSALIRVIWINIKQLGDL